MHSVLCSQAAEFELLKLSNKARFILAVVAGTLVVSNRRKADIESDLDMQGFVRIAPAKKVSLPFYVFEAAVSNVHDSLTCKNDLLQAS